MSKRRKRRAKNTESPPTPPPAPTGVAQLLSEAHVDTLDLHGYTAHQAELRLKDFLATHARISAGSVVHVITGKSTAVLLDLVRDMLAEDAADQVDEYAGMMGGGGWVVRLRAQARRRGGSRPTVG